MSSSDEKKGDNRSPKKDSYLPDEYGEDDLERWDEWYDDSVMQNKKSKIKRSNKRAFKNKNEW